MSFYCFVVLISFSFVETCIVFVCASRDSATLALTDTVDWLKEGGDVAVSCLLLSVRIFECG